MSKTQKNMEEARKKFLVIEKGILSKTTGKVENLNISKNQVLKINVKS